MWSPQHYRDKGRELGFDPSVVDQAANAVDDFLDISPDLPPILTLGHLARRTGLSYFKLRSIVSGSRWHEYEFFRIHKRSGGRRLISVPDHRLMRAQRWIAAHILAKLPVHRASYAFAPHSSIRKCAEQHRGARWLIKLDVSGFFGSISEIQVYRVFREAGYVPLVSLELARLCTHAPGKSARYNRREWLANYSPERTFYGQLHLGFLPQGAPTSPMLSNLIMIETDKLIAKLAAREGLTYTRYSDDITFSTTGNFDRRRAISVVRETSSILRRTGLRVNTKKTRIVPPGGRKVVLGLLVDGAEPKLTREFRDRLRQHLFYLEKLGPEAHRSARGFDTVSGLYRHIRGLIDFAKSIDADYAAVMLGKFHTVAWSLDAASEP